MSDQLCCEPRFRLRTLVDNFGRVSLAIESGQGMIGDRFVEVLEKVCRLHRSAEVIQVDNGPEFISRSIDW